MFLGVSRDIFKNHMVVSYSHDPEVVERRRTAREANIIMQKDCGSFRNFRNNFQPHHQSTPINSLSNPNPPSLHLHLNHSFVYDPIVYLVQIHIFLTYFSPLVETRLCKRAQDVETEITFDETNWLHN